MTLGKKGGIATTAVAGYILSESVLPFFEYLFMIRFENLKYKAKKVKMQDTPPIIMVVNSQNKMDILKSVPLSIHEKYFRVN